MTDQVEGDRALERRRAAALEALVEHLAEEHLDVTAFDARIERVRTAESAGDVDGALAGLPGRSGAA